MPNLEELYLGNMPQPEQEEEGPVIPIMSRNKITSLKGLTDLPKIRILDVRSNLIVSFDDLFENKIADEKELANRSFLGHVSGPGSTTSACTLIRNLIYFTLPNFNSNFEST